MNPDWFFCFLPGWLLPTKFKMAFACICPKVQGGVAQWLWQFNGTGLNGKLIGLNGDRLNMGLNGKLIGLWSEIMVISWNRIWRDLMVFNIQVREILPFIQIWLVVWNMFYSSIQSRIIILTDELIFFRGVGSNHQPVTIHPDKISPDSHESLITIHHHSSVYKSWNPQKNPQIHPKLSQMAQPIFHGTGFVSSHDAARLGSGWFPCTWRIITGMRSLGWKMNHGLPNDPKKSWRNDSGLLMDNIIYN